MTVPHRIIPLLALLAGLIPLYFQPMRIEPNEPARAGLIGLGALVVVWALAHGEGRHVRRAAWVIAAFAGLTLITALVSLSPATSLMGELVRRYGALTQIAILGGAVGGALIYAHYGGAALARVLWLVGIVVGVIALLQQARVYPTISPTYYPLRSSSIIGYPTYLGGWAALCALIGVVYAPFAARWYHQIIWWLGIGLIASAVIPSGARTATLALAAGIGTAILGAAAVRRWRWIVALIALGAVAGGLVLPRLIGLEGVPLFQRLALDVRGNATQDLRYAMWERGMGIGALFPTLVSDQGQPDAASALRAALGYGADMQATVYGLLPPVDGYAFDRAHNLWIDSLLTGGWIGLAARLLLVIGGAAYALKRLGLLRLWLALPVGVGVVAAAVLGRDSVWLPVILTGGAIAGLWAGLLLHSLLARGQPSAIDRPALLLLAALVAIVIDTQLGFETVAVMALFWVIAGGALARTEGAAPLPTRVIVGIVALGGAALLRGIVYNAPNSSAAAITGACALGLLMLGAGYWLWLERRRFSVRQWGAGLLLIGGLWAAGVWGVGWTLPLAGVWDVLWALAAVALCVYQPGTQRIEDRPAMMRRVAIAVIGIVALGLWWLDTSADIALRDGNVFVPGMSANDQSALGASLRVWDARAQLLYVDQVWMSAQTADETTQRALIATAEAAIDRAAALNPFIPDLPARRSAWATLAAP